jgi:methylenetetrahydrofolate--tRNA-(uracil-5-)-methyltransferase
MDVNFGLLPPLPQRIRDKRARKEAYTDRAAAAMGAWVADQEALFVGIG